MLCSHVLNPPRSRSESADGNFDSAHGNFCSAHGNVHDMAWSGFTWSVSTFSLLWQLDWIRTRSPSFQVKITGWPRFGSCIGRFERSRFSVLTVPLWKRFLIADNTVLTERDFLEKRFRQFRFPVPVRFLGHLEIRSGGGSRSGWSGPVAPPDMF